MKKHSFLWIIIFWGYSLITFLISLTILNLFQFYYLVKTLGSMLFSYWGICSLSAIHSIPVLLNTYCVLGSVLGNIISTNLLMEPTDWGTKTTASLKAIYGFTGGQAWQSFLLTDSQLNNWKKRECSQSPPNYQGSIKGPCFQTGKSRGIDVPSLSKKGRLISQQEWHPGGGQGLWVLQHLRNQIS